MLPQSQQSTNLQSATKSKPESIGSPSGGLAAVELTRSDFIRAVLPNLPEHDDDDQRAEGTKREAGARVRGKDSEPGGNPDHLRTDDGPHGAADLPGTDREVRRQQPQVHSGQARQGLRPRAR